jgi:hypothetical protein
MDGLPFVSRAVKRRETPRAAKTGSWPPIVARAAELPKRTRIMRSWCFVLAAKFDDSLLGAGKSHFIIMLSTAHGLDSVE